MNRLYLAGARRRPIAGQAIYQAMLAITCVALAVAIVFPVMHYVRRHYNQSAGPGYSSPRPAARQPQPAPEPAPKPETEVKTEDKKEGEAAPAGDAEAPEPAAATTDTTDAPADE